MQYIQYIKKSIVLIGFLGLNAIALAGSYEDFFKAVRLDDVKTVQALLQRGFDPNTVSPNGSPALMLAVREPSLKVAQLLASWPKIKTEVRNDKDESVLMLAALKGYLPLVKQLVDNDADVNKPGWTPLHYAASTGQVAVIEFLLDNSAYIDAESPNGSTPLMMAAMYGSPEAVKVLIQAGADLNIKNQLGLTALDFAVRGNRQNAKELIETGLQRQAVRAAKAQSSTVTAPVSIPATNSASKPPSTEADSRTTAPLGQTAPAQPVAPAEAQPASKPFKTGW
jgi:ankyrin repeat protein